MNLLNQFADEMHQKYPQAMEGLPPLKRLWGLAKYERDHVLAEALPDAELVGLVAEALLTCLRTYDDLCPPNAGEPRRGTQDRFTYFFHRRLVWALNAERRQTQKVRRKSDPHRYRGLRDERHDDARSRARTALLQAVHRALAHLDPADLDLIDRRYWQGQTVTALAAEAGFTSRFQARRALDRVHDTLRRLVVAELEEAVAA